MLIALAAAIVVPGVALAQPPATVKEARTLLAAGRPVDALALLENAATAEALQAKTEAAAKAGRFETAAAAYTALVKVSRTNDPGLLHLVGREYLLALQASNDQLARVEACDALNRAKLMAEVPACATDLRKWAQDVATPPPVRAAAAATLARAGDSAAADVLKAIGRDATTDSTRRLLVSVLGGVPSAVAVPLLVPMLQAEDGGVQFSAASLLGEHRTPAARKALQDYLAITDRRIARGAAELALATQGDAAALQRLSGEVENLAGGDLYAAGLALRAAGNPKGTAALVQVANGDNETLRLLASVHLAETHAPIASAAFSSGMASKNPLLRAATLREFRRTQFLTPATLVAGVADPAPEVRTEAALGLVILNPASAARAARPDAPAGKR